jgi:hypothetical protein
MTRIRRTLSVAAVLGLSAAAAHHAASHLMRAEVQALLGPAAHDRIAVDPLTGRVAIDGLRVAGTDGSLRIGRVVLQSSTALVAPARAAENFTLENVTAEFQGSSYAAPQIEVRNSAASKADVQAIFDPASGQPLSARLAKLTADSVVVPQLTGIQNKAGTTSTLTYRDLRLDGIAAGQIKSLKAAGGTFEGKTGDKGGKGTFGAVLADNIDTVLIARVYTEKGQPGEPLKPVYSGFSVDKIEGTAADGGTFSLARLSGKDVSARPGSVAWLDLFAELATKPDIAKLPSADRNRLVTGLLDLLEGFSIGSMEATDMRFASQKGGEPGTAKITRMAYTGAAQGRQNQFTIEGFEAGSGDNKVRIGSITHSGWSMQPLINALREALKKPDADLTQLEPRRLIPDIGSFAIRDLEASGAEKGKDPFRFTLKGFEVQTGAPIMGVPTTVRINLDHAAMPLPPQPKEDGLKDLAAMGYKDIDMSLAFDARWDEGTGDLSVRQLQLDGVNMGSAVLRGVIGNVSRDVFAGDATTAQIALLGATVKQVSVNLDNKGLAEKALAREAQRQKRTPDQLRKELAGVAALGVPAMLGGTPGAKAVGNAVAKFIGKPGKLSVEAKAKDPQGLGVADFAMAAGNPADLVGQIDLTATAE